MGRIGRFTKGGIFGVALGATFGLLVAPGPGVETRHAVVERIQRVRKAGVDAEAATKQEFIQRYREQTRDASALKETETQTKMERAERLAHIDATRPAL